MHRSVCLVLLALARPALAAALVGDAYVCTEQRVALRIVNDADLAPLGATQLFASARAAEVEIGQQVAKLDADAAKINERLNIDREAIKTGKALEFQTGVRQNWRPTEMALHDGEATLANLTTDRERLLTEQKRWTEITTACSVATARANVVVVQGQAKNRLTAIRVKANEPDSRAWIPTRFLAKAAKKE